MLSHRPRSRVRVEHYPMGYQAMADDDPFRRVNLWQLVKAGCLVLMFVFACGGITAFLLLGGASNNTGGLLPVTLTPTATPSQVGNISFDWTNTPSPTLTVTPSITPTPTNVWYTVTPIRETSTSTPTITPSPTITNTLVWYTATPFSELETLPTQGYFYSAPIIQEVFITSPPQIIEVTVVVVEQIQVIVTATPEPIIVITNPPPLTLLQPPTAEITEEVTDEG